MMPMEPRFGFRGMNTIRHRDHVLGRTFHRLECADRAEFETLETLSRTPGALEQWLRARGFNIGLDNFTGFGYIELGR